MAVRNSSVSLVQPLYTQKEGDIQPIHAEEIRGCGYEFPKRMGKTVHHQIHVADESTGSEASQLFNSRAKSFTGSQVQVQHPPRQSQIGMAVNNPQNEPAHMHSSRYKSKVAIVNEIRQSKIEKQQQVQAMKLSQLKTDRRTQMEQLYTKLYTYYMDHKIDLAHLTSQQMVNQYQNELQQHEQFQQRQKFIDMVKVEYDDMMNYWVEFDKPGWNLKSKDKNVRIYSKEDGGNVAIKLESQLDVPIEKFVTILNEVDLHKKFVPFVVKSTTEKVIARNRKIGHVVSNLPFISMRQAFFEGVGYDRLEANGTIFVYSRSIHNRQDLQQLFGYTPKPKKDSVMLNYKCMSIEYKPLSVGRGLIRMCVNVDMNIKFIPTFILESSSKTFCHDLFSNLVKISKKFEGSEWDIAVQKNPELFNFFKKVVNQYVSKH